MTIVHAIRHNAQSTLLINSLNKQNAIWTSRTNAIYQFKKHLGKLPAGLEEQAASSDETTGLLPDTVKVYLLSKLLYPPPNPSVRLLGSQGLKRLSVQTPNVRRLRQKRCNSVLVYLVLTWAPLTTFQIALPTTAHTRYKVRFRPHSRAKTASISSFSHLCRIAFESVINWMNSLILEVIRAKIVLLLPCNEQNSCVIHTVYILEYI